MKFDWTEHASMFGANAMWGDWTEALAANGMHDYIQPIVACVVAFRVGNGCI